MPRKAREDLELVKIHPIFRKISMRDAKSLIRKLNFASAVFPAGRTFLWRLYELTVGMYRPNNEVWLKSKQKENLRVWWDFLENHSGKTFWPAYQSLSLLFSHLNLTDVPTVMQAFLYGFRSFRRSGSHLTFNF